MLIVLQIRIKFNISKEMFEYFIVLQIWDYEMEDFYAYHKWTHFPGLRLTNSES